MTQRPDLLASGDLGTSSDTRSRERWQKASAIAARNPRWPPWPGLDANRRWRCNPQQPLGASPESPAHQKAQPTTSFGRRAPRQRRKPYPRACIPPRRRNCRRTRAGPRHNTQTLPERPAPPKCKTRHCRKVRTTPTTRCPCPQPRPRPRRRRPTAQHRGCRTARRRRLGSAGPCPPCVSRRRRTRRRSRRLLKPSPRGSVEHAARSPPSCCAPTPAARMSTRQPTTKAGPWRQSISQALASERACQRQRRHRPSMSFQPPSRR
mmetsp:Transcript_48974/g.157547  ORF Transcript_48974/g.157547 Transcript_48974/m.157547 type:complete len:264 (+) Transcript_48974:1061-1852(+)